MSSPLTGEEKAYLLQLARSTIASALDHKPLPDIDIDALPENLTESGASFVTLTIHGNLRGCIGTLEARQSLVNDVQEHAIEAAFEDYRFPPLRKEEFAKLEIEISRLTAPIELDYDAPADLPFKLRPGIDGVILQDGFRRATFLPQVWDQLPVAEEFLGHLCAKMGAPMDLWRTRKLKVKTYQVEEFHE